MKNLRCDRTHSWKKLQAQNLVIEENGFDLRAAFEQDPQRFSKWSQPAPHLFSDLSKNYLTDSIEENLQNLAQECQVLEKRSAMFKGEAINCTEKRMVGHVWLRAPNEHCYQKSIGELLPEAKQALASVFSSKKDLLDFAKKVRTNDSITDIVNIGIGGSDLGPQMVCAALESFSHPHKRIHFVSNIDGHELLQILKKLQPESTLFIIASKSFSTLEPLLNAQAAKDWYLKNGGKDIARHFCAVSSNIKAAQEFGIEHIFGFGDWVGGRYSVWSSIGLSVAISIGAEHFEALLAGAHDMDMHFLQADSAQNLPLRLGLLDVWYRLLGQATRCVTPYHSALGRLPSYLQQLEMESNGKSTDVDGQPLSYDTSPVIWGEVGTNAQHAYFQMLHQGTRPITTEIIAVRHCSHALKSHHHALLANAIGQAQALMQGKSNSNGFQNFSGNRPSSFILLNELSPACLGSLIALYEHRVFVSGAVWGINSFDQWGVQLGKVLANDIEQRMAIMNISGLDSSTAGLLNQLR